jgi:dTDP-4-dehydrorhamnose 3,5-epimerase
MFIFEPMSIPAVILVKPKLMGDSRGFLIDSYRHSVFADNGITDVFVQDNLSHSRQHVLRGLHYQVPPKAHAKLISVPYGKILDIAVDLRRDSPYYSQWVGTELSEENRHQLYIPVGFAHGFLVLSEEATITYKISAEYAPECEAGIRWDDPTIGIEWGIDNPVLSQRDPIQPSLGDAKHPFSYTVSK